MSKRKKKSYFFCILLFICHLFFGEGLERLAKRTSDSIGDFFSDKYNIKISITKFENFSGISDLTTQKFYQLLVSKLESNNKYEFIDLLVNFSNRKGNFNFNRVNKLNYLVYIKLIRNKDKIGVGTVIFSRLLDKIVYLKYFEENFPLGERDLFNTTDYGFKTLGFSKIIEINTNRNLLDCKAIRNLNGELRYFFYYPQRIEIFRIQGSSLKKTFSFKLNWGRPYYPVIEYEGKLSFFYKDKILYITAGGNFTLFSKIFVFTDNKWKEIEKVNFVPIKLIELNNNYYLAGARYEEGKNYFKNKIILTPFDVKESKKKREYYEKKAPLFYSIDFSTRGKSLESIHIIDKNYNYRFYTADFEERIIEGKKYGSSLCSINGKWLAVSDYSRLNDKLYFYQIEHGSLKLVYENKIRGEIVFISNGVWKSKVGFWVYVKLIKKQGEEFKLQFWSKSNE